MAAATVIPVDSDSDIQDKFHAVDIIEESRRTMRTAQIFEDATDAECVDYGTV